ncbi:MAG: hypothetical protein AB7U75_15640 [Hyphomicrobiaceae bacterium]
MKNFKLTLAALAAAAGLATTAQAAEVAAYRGQSIDLGAVTGVAYYTVEQGGYRVVATLADTDSKAAVRFEAVLAPGQSVVLSSPAARGRSPARIEISRVGARVEVASSPVTN